MALLQEEAEHQEEGPEGLGPLRDCSVTTAAAHHLLIS